MVGAKGDVQHNFQLHWLNNKELQFTMEAEVILQELHKSSVSHHHHDADMGSDSDGFPDHLSPSGPDGEEQESAGSYNTPPFYLQYN